MIKSIEKMRLLKQRGIRAINLGSGAGLDVFDVEPVPKDEPVLTLENVVFAPHQAGFTVEAYHRMAVVAAEEILRTLRGEEPRYVVNKAYLKRRSSIPELN